MRKIIKIFILCTLICLSSCNNSSKQDLKVVKPESDYSETKPEEIFYDTKLEDIVKDFETWYNYDYYNINLAQDFIALDTSSKVLSKTQFLKKLLSGKFLAIKTALKEGIPTYKLFRFNNTDSGISGTIMQSASLELSNYKMEGKRAPDFDFTDLNGVVYNKSTTKGKILIVKCWFIHCTACVKEFPELNKLVNEYKQNKNIIFLSLATDKKNDLINFLKKKPFNYAVIPNLDSGYMEQYWQVHQYPTHLFVDQNGTIQKAVNSVDDLIAFLRKAKL